MVSKKRKSSIQEKKEKIRAQAWPELDDEMIWHRLKTDGWLSLPRAMPLVLRIMDLLAPKGKPVSQTYLELWCRTFDDSFLIVTNPREMAFFSGFSGERAETTWKTRIKLLNEMGFIDIKGSPMNPVHYILIYNPYLILQKHHESGLLKDDLYETLVQRLIEIGADDLQKVSHDKDQSNKIDVDEIMNTKL